MRPWSNKKADNASKLEHTSVQIWKWRRGSVKYPLATRKVFPQIQKNNAVKNANTGGANQMKWYSVTMLVTEHFETNYEQAAISLFERKLDQWSTSMTWQVRNDVKPDLEVFPKKRNLFRAVCNFTSLALGHLYSFDVLTAPRALVHVLKHHTLSATRPIRNRYDSNAREMTETVRNNFSLIHLNDEPKNMRLRKTAIIAKKGNGKNKISHRAHVRKDDDLVSRPRMSDSL